MRRFIALTAALALALPLVFGFGASPARAEGNTAANVALGLAAFAVFHQLFAPVIVAPAPPPVIVRPAPVYREVPVYRDVPVYRTVPVYPSGPRFRTAHYPHGRPDPRGHGQPHHR
jgi:hypothetical protein